MGVVIDLNSHGSELAEQAFDLLLARISAHVAKLFVFISGQDFVHHSSQLVCDCDFCLIF